MADKKRSFRFSLHGVTLAGELTNPAKRLLPVKGCVALPPGGGYAFEEVDPDEVSESTDGVVQVRRAYARSSGVIADAGDPDASEDGKGAYQSLTTTVIEGLNIREIVYADRIVGQIATRQQPNGQGDPRFTLAGTDIVGLRIAGRPVDVIFEDAVRRARTHDQLVDAVAGDAALANRLNVTGLLGHAASARDLSKKVAKDLRSRKEAVRASLVRGLCIDGSNRREPVPNLANKRCDDEFEEFEIRIRQGLEIRIPLFGRIHLGEIHIGRRERRITMFKVDLGCPVEGRYEGGDVCDDSGWYPP